MATAREYLDSLVNALARVQALQPSDDDLEDWHDDLQGAEERICMLAGCLEDTMGSDGNVVPAKQYVFITGGPSCGFTFYGPVTTDAPGRESSAVDATYWAELLPLAMIEGDDNR